MKSATLDVIAGLQPEEEQEPEKKVEVVITPELERILRGFEQFLVSYTPSLDDVITRLDPLRIPATTITQASIALAAYSTHPNFWQDAGYYLTALVNGSLDEEHTLFTRGYSQPPDAIGYKLRKRLTVHGTTEKYAGYENHGELILVGNTGHQLGCFNKGKIILTGDAGNDAGGHNSGQITINGNAGESFSLANMGTIFLNGTYKSLAEDLGRGDIYQNGVLIVDKGRRLV